MESNQNTEFPFPLDYIYDALIYVVLRVSSTFGSTNCNKK